MSDYETGDAGYDGGNDTYANYEAGEQHEALDQLHQVNASAAAELLVAHSAVEKVYFPGISTHPGHTLARKQQRGFGAMLSFELAGGQPAVEAFVDGLQCFTLAESLGGVESLIAHPATMTHASMDAAARQRAGISDGLLRLSVGIEASEDLLADIATGLARAEAVAAEPNRARA